MSQSEKELTYKAFLNREYEFRHSPFEKEFEFYDCVKSGDTDSVERLMTPLGSSGAGVLSQDPLRNLKYHFIVTIALITRFCVEGGMEMETAYTLSDLYILKADKCTCEKDIHALHREAVLEFTRQMNKLAHGNVYSKPVIMTMDYIYDNLHSKISEADIAEYISLSPSYISRLFKKEVGVTICTYIAVKRVETAQNMLKYSDYSPVDIGNYLAFTSHSHFISVFRKYTGMTPNEFRKKYYRDNWGDIKHSSAKK
ncbi:MAG: AraC family transcriptional regulator [Oscillospiraceae bacterium]|nr:AraC family transcriptional regulator [Oscillospiraceae bacterium]MDY6207886.1 AraC family transcriptional regulator [Oscillospiraceae bacterium]